MIAKEQLLTASAFSQWVKEYKGVLTSAEAFEHARAPRGRLTVIRSLKANKFFFSDDHCFGVHVLPEHFVPCTMEFPRRIVPREGLEDGWVDTIEKYIRIFQKDCEQITSIEELVDFLNQAEVSV